MAEHASPFAGDTTRTMTSDEQDALAAVLAMGLVNASDLATKLKQMNLVEATVECGNLASSASYVIKIPAIVGIELERLYVQGDSITDNVTINVTKGGTSITSTAAAVALNDANDDWQQVPLIATAASRRAGFPDDPTVVNQSTEGFTITVTADGSGAVTKLRVHYAYSRV